MPQARQVNEAALWFAYAPVRRSPSSQAREPRDILVAVQLRFYLDAATGQPHVLGHGVTESEVEGVLEKPGEDRAGRDGSRVAIGQTGAGRYLRIIYVPDPIPDSVFVITAYELRGKPLDAYRRRRRKKHSR